MNATSLCSRCAQTKPAADFYANPRYASGCSSQCKACQRAYLRARYDADPEMGRRRSREYRARNQGAVRWARYRMTHESYLDLRRAQGDACAICARAFGGMPQMLVHVDHSHGCCPQGRQTCGECNRGILCKDCNVGIGSFMDDPSRLRAAAAYLERYG